MSSRIRTRHQLVIRKYFFSFHGEVLGPSPIYTGANPEIQVIAKRLSKKNSSTRAKALNDLKIILEVGPTPDRYSIYRG